MDLQLIYICIVFISFLTALIWSKNHPKYFRWLSFLLLVTFIVESCSYYMRQHHMERAFIFHFYAPLEFSVFSWLFYKEIKSPQICNLILWIIPAFLIFSLANIFYLQKIKTYNSYGFMVRGILCVCWVLFYFYDLYKQEQFKNPLKLSMFWISVGLLFFFSGTIFLNGYIEELMKRNMDLARKVYKINTYLNIFLYLSIAYGLTCRTPKKLL